MSITQQLEALHQVEDHVYNLPTLRKNLYHSLLEAIRDKVQGKMKELKTSPPHKGYTFLHPTQKRFAHFPVEYKLYQSRDLTVGHQGLWVYVGEHEANLDQLVEFHNLLP